MAAYVCHQCGKPICERCVKIVSDPEFVTFDSSWGRFLLALFVILGAIFIPIVIGDLLPAGWNFPIILSGIVIGVAMLSTLHIQKSTPARKLYAKAAHCRNCYSKHNLQEIIGKLLLIFGFILVLCGAYPLVLGLNPAFLIITSIGIFIILVKNNIIYAKFPIRAAS